ncbi:MAG TPA: hypothetical protein VI198_02240 [Candidatus Eisenbacteria bacterium]
MNERERDALIEAGVSVHRERDREGRLIPPPEYWDLSPEDVDELFRRQVVSREMERAMDREGRSATVKAVLARLGIG